MVGWLRRRLRGWGMKQRERERGRLRRDWKTNGETAKVASTKRKRKFCMKIASAI